METARRDRRIDIEIIASETTAFSILLKTGCVMPGDIIRSEAAADRSFVCGVEVKATWHDVGGFKK
jgi:hypothetical protein